jgi:hypothetical protein
VEERRFRLIKGDGFANPGDGPAQIVRFERTAVWPYLEQS